eukprot:gene27192-biopygen3839
MKKLVRWNRSKIMLVGQGRAGKIALVNNLAGRWMEETASTIGAEQMDMRLDEVDLHYRKLQEVDTASSYKLLLVDFGGQSIFNVLHGFFMSRYGVYVVVFDMELFLSGDAACRESCRKELKFWLNSITMHTSDSTAGTNKTAPVAIVEEKGLEDVIILDPIEYLVKPATTIICKHVATKDDPYRIRHEIGEIHGERGKKTHVFLSHDWGIDGNNHHRVKQVSDALKSRGLVTWIDEERLVNEIDEKIIDGIDHTECMLVFVTENYVRKVNGGNEWDYCKREFKYGCSRLGVDRLIVVVLDEAMKDSSKWHGLIRFNLGSVMYYDLSTIFEASSCESEESVNGLMDGLYEKIFTTITGHKPQKENDSSK